MYTDTNLLFQWLVQMGISGLWTSGHIEMDYLSSSYLHNLPALWDQRVPKRLVRAGSVARR